MSSATRQMKDKGEGQIGDMQTREKRLEPRGSGNSANDFPDLIGDGKVTLADILQGRGVIGKKKGKNYGQPLQRRR